ncbi:MAG TPA: ATP-dependent DNA helicase RecG, partial [Anaerolineae bacterium]|nr:ATP-dependent DNA helicase RecG [Anaerolineae bacterium]
MARAFIRLQRVLDLEAQQGYQNKAVVGGIRQFATFWVGQAQEEAIDEQDRAFIEQVAEVLSDYGRLPGPEARKKALDNLNVRLKQREERVAALAPAAPVKPAPPPRRDTAVAKTAPPPPKPQPKPQAKTAPVKVKEKPKPAKIVPAEPDPEGLRQPVTILQGVGPKVGELLAKLGAKTIGELLYIFPRRYDDYTLMKPISKLEYGEQVTIIGTIWETRARRTRTNQIIVESVISDGTGSVKASWFNQRWLVGQLKAGMQIVISGKVEQFLGRPVFNNPEWEPLEIEPLRTRRIVPVYPLTKGLSSNKMREIMRTAVTQWAPRVPDPLPTALRQRLKLDNLTEALVQTHFPDRQQTLHNGRRRLTFDELFLLQLGMQASRRDWQSQPGISIPTDESALVLFRKQLPFEFTGAQQRVVKEIANDMADGAPMNRLLQGDVGSGKTVVAAAALLLAAKAGYQTAMMAPTEILAEQHGQGLDKLLTPLGLRLALLTGSVPAAEKERIYAALTAGEIDVLIGTHALIQEGVTFKNLALAVIDEQHRFGVDQRQALRDKGTPPGEEKRNPHLLTMSATPIPRSLALSLYGDLDLSILDEMPPGRQEIKTRWLATRERERAYAFVRGQIKKGRQAYIIYPLVEESDKIEAKAAVADYERLQKEVFPDLRVGLIHGRLKSVEKEAVMRAFYQGEIDILVSTSVIEVGVDVPNASVMLIEGANRFGLAQLHQFRGRVG